MRSITHTAIVLALLFFARTALGVTFHSSASSDRIYITGPGAASLSDVKAALPKADLHQVSPGVWHLRQNLIVQQGAKLLLHGTKIGGDVKQLRIQSNNTGESNAFVFISADYGSLDIRSTAVTSWDDAANGPDLEHSVFGRAFIRVRSSLDPDGVTPRESRMDIIDSDVGYLGSHRSESYGLVWKVVSSKTNATYGAVTNLYNLVNVYGDILRSRLHHNYFGMYSYGAFGMYMADNEVDHNVGYGFDPHDDSDYLVIERNNVHHNGNHGIIASQRCNNTIIRDNLSWANVGCGIMLHRYCDDSLIEGNRSFRNTDAGIALFDVKRVVVRSNTCLENFNAGVRCSVGAADNLIENNEFAYGGNFGLYLYKGVDAPFPGDNGHSKRNRFINNYVHHNAGPGIFVTTSDDNVFSRNIFEANSTTLLFVNGKRNVLESNSIPREVLVRAQATAALPGSLIARQQPALAIQLDAYSTMTFSDPGGAIFDPEEPGIATTVAAGGASLQLTTTEIAKTSYVQTRKLQVTPDAGQALITITIWNTTGDLSKRWLTQASSETRSVQYRVGDLVPGTIYRVLKDGSATLHTADANGVITFVDNATTTGVTEFMVTL